MKVRIAKLVMWLTITYVKLCQTKWFRVVYRVLWYITLPIRWIIKTVKKFTKWYIKHRSIKILNKYMGSTAQLILGLPGSGKTTFASYIAKLCKNAGYSCYCNFKCSIAGTYNFDDLGKYDYGSEDTPSYWIFDEAGISANNRNFSVSFSGKNGSPALEHLKLLRHYNCRVIILSQSMDMDIKLRLMCARIWLLYKGPFCSNLTPVQRNIGCDEVQHQLMDMYDISSPLKRAFERVYFFRRPYYKYFDTHERPELPHIHDKSGSTRTAGPCPSKGMDDTSVLINSLISSMMQNKDDQT